MVEIKREDLYERAWSEPAVKLAKVLGLSGPGLAKACRKHRIPMPERGYWARVAAGKQVIRHPLPPRGLGMPSVIRLGRDRRGCRISDAELDPDLPPPPAPEFPESMDDVRARVAKLVGRVRPVRSLEDALPVVRRYLEADEERRRKMAMSRYNWDAPKFESPTEQRRLQILNSLAAGALRLGCALSTSGPDARELSVLVGEQFVGFKLEADGSAVRSPRRGHPAKNSLRLRLQIDRREYPGGPLKDWTDAKGAPIERHLSDMLVELLVAGEQFHRNHAEHRHRWILEQRARRLEERLRRAEEAERERRERIEAEARARRRRLLGECRDWRIACDLRAYVEAVEAASEAEPESRRARVLAWAAWARSEAAKLDPVYSRRAIEGWQ